MRIKVKLSALGQADGMNTRRGSAMAESPPSGQDHRFQIWAGNRRALSGLSRGFPGGRELGGKA
jgi:hypothetical protein